MGEAHKLKYLKKAKIGEAHIKNTNRQIKYTALFLRPKFLRYFLVDEKQFCRMETPVYFSKLKELKTLLTKKTEKGFH